MEQDHGYELLVGIDWATEAHQVCTLGMQGKVLDERSIPHSGAGIGELIEWLTRFAAGEPSRVAVAIETPRGAVVESLVERDFHVFAINPKQLDRFRDRHTVAGAKDDRRDAFVLADSLRTDLHCFRRVKVDDPLVIQLRELSRVDEELRQETNRLTNRLREQLRRFYPQVFELSPSVNEPWLWELLELAPSPHAGAKLRRPRVAALLKRHRIRRLDADTVVMKLRESPLRVAPGTVEAASAHIALLLPRLRLAHEQRTQCARRIEGLLDCLGEQPACEDQRREHRDVQILRSLPGAGRVVVATMLAEASQPLAERDYHRLRALAGVAPITRQSGRSCVVVMRRACNGRLRYALYHLARVAVQCDAHWRELYAGLRKRGHGHGRALRGVADRMLVVLVAMLEAGTTYDPRRAHRPPTGSNLEAVA